MIAEPNIIISWKGRTFNEVVSVKKKNQGHSGSIFKANPLKLYRREIDLTGCGERTSASTNTMEVPGFTSINSSSATCNGLQGTKDFNYVELKSENGGLKSGSVCFSKANDAKRRVRSSGMPKNSYFTNTNQYLEKRAKTFKQNQYAVVRQGDASAVPGTGAAQQNIYSSYGVTKCKLDFHQDETFVYYWWNTTDPNAPTQSSNTVTIPRGEYDIQEINSIFQNTMIQNYHYVVKKNGNTKVTFMDFTYNRAQQKIEFRTTMPNGSFANVYSEANGYELPKDETGNVITSWVLPTNPAVGYYILGINIPSGFLNSALGLTGNYPANIISGSSATAESTYLSSLNPGLKPKYMEVHYKPNNPQYGSQGAVSSSSRIARLKYNSITNSSVAYNTAYGPAVANALAYGVPSPGYTEKDKIGYPIKRTPVFVLGESQKRCCYVRTIRNMI